MERYEILIFKVSPGSSLRSLQKLEYSLRFIIFCICAPVSYKYMLIRKRNARDPQTLSQDNGIITMSFPSCTTNVISVH